MKLMVHLVVGDDRGEERFDSVLEAEHPTKTDADFQTEWLAARKRIQETSQDGHDSDDVINEMVTQFGWTITRPNANLVTVYD